MVRAGEGCHLRIPVRDLGKVEGLSKGGKGLLVLQARPSSLLLFHACKKRGGSGSPEGNSL